MHLAAELLVRFFVFGVILTPFLCLFFSKRRGVGDGVEESGDTTNEIEDAMDKSNNATNKSNNSAKSHTVPACFSIQSILQ